MKYLITGKGVVGQYLVKRLLETAGARDQIVHISRQHRYFYEDHPGRETALLLECYADLRYNPIRLISQYQPSVVIHAAGEGRQSAPAKDIWSANVDTTLNLLNACALLKEKVRFVLCSSITVTDKPFTIYSASKLAAEGLVKSFSDMYEYINGTSTRFCAVAGAGNKHGVVTAVIQKLLDKNTDCIELLSNSRKPMLYAGHLADKIINMSSCDNLESTLNVCPYDNISVDEIVDIAMYLTGIQKGIRFNPKAAWSGDKITVQPTKKSYSQMVSSETAVKLAIKDILREDYNYAG